MRQLRKSTPPGTRQDPGRVARTRTIARGKWASARESGKGNAIATVTRGKWASALVVGLVLVLTGCGPTSTTTPTPSVTPTMSTTPSATPVPPSPGPQTNPVDRSKISNGGIFHLGVTAFPGSWNPWNMSVFNLNPVIDAMTPRLFATAADGTLQWDPDWLASQPLVTYSTTPGQAMTVTYSLNPKAVWSDGMPITAADFEATWQACTTVPGPACQDREFNHVTGVSAGTSPGQVVVSYDVADPGWAYTFARGPFRADFVSNPTLRDATWTSLTGQNAVFSGPYAFGSFDGTTMTLLPNPLWWGASPKLDSIKVTVATPDNAILQYMRQNLDSFWVNDVNLYAQAAAVSGIQIRRDSGTSTRVLLMNCTTGPLADPDVRQAILLGLDRRALGASDLAGWKWDGSVLNSPLWVREQSSYTDLTQSSANSSPTVFTTAAATALLDRDGWQTGPDGVRSKNGVQLAWDFLVPNGDTLTENEGFQLRTQLAGLGIKVNLSYADPADVPDLLSSGQYAMTATTEAVTTPLAAAARFTAGNPEGFSDPQVDSLYQQAVSQPDPAQLTVLLDELAQRVWQTTPVIPLYEVPTVLMTRPGLANYGPGGLGTILWENVGWAT